MRCSGTHPKKEAPSRTGGLSPPLTGWCGYGGATPRHRDSVAWARGGADGTIAAAASLARTGPRASESVRKPAIAEAMRVATDVLGNTPSIARGSYIDPRVLDRYRQGETIELASGGSPEAALRSFLVD